MYHYKQCTLHVMAALLIVTMTMPIQAYPWYSSNRWLSRPIVLGAITVLSLTVLGSLAAYYLMGERLENPDAHQNDEGDDGIRALLGAGRQQQDFLPNHNFPIRNEEDFNEALRLQQQYDQINASARGVSGSFVEREHEEGAGIEDFSDEEYNNAVGKEEEDAPEVNVDEFGFEDFSDEEPVDFNKEIEKFLLSDMPKSKHDIEDDIQRIATYEDMLGSNDSLRPKLKLRWLRNVMAITDNPDEKRDAQQQLRKLQAHMRCNMLSKNK